jgi:hypothetical protein
VEAPNFHVVKSIKITVKPFRPKWPPHPPPPPPWVCNVLGIPPRFVAPFLARLANHVHLVGSAASPARSDGARCRLAVFVRVPASQTAGDRVGQDTPPPARGRRVFAMSYGTEGGFTTICEQYSKHRCWGGHWTVRRDRA